MNIMRSKAPDRHLEEIERVLADLRVLKALDTYTEARIDLSMCLRERPKELSDAVWLAEAEIVDSISSVLRAASPSKPGAWIQSRQFGDDRFIVEMVRRATTQSPGFFIIRREPSRSGRRESLVRSCDLSTLLVWRECPKKRKR